MPETGSESQSADALRAAQSAIAPGETQVSSEPAADPNFATVPTDTTPSADTADVDAVPDDQTFTDDAVTSSDPDSLGPYDDADAQSFSARTPLSFPTFSHSGNNRRSWIMPEFWIAHELIASTEDGEVEQFLEDKVTANVQVDPGANVSKVRYFITYLPQSSPTPYFSDIHLEVWALCTASFQLCNTEDTGNWDAGGPLKPIYISSSTSMYGDKLTHAVKL